MPSRQRAPSQFNQFWAKCDARMFRTTTSQFCLISTTPSSNRGCSPSKVSSMLSSKSLPEICRNQSNPLIVAPCLHRQQPQVGVGISNGLWKLTTLGFSHSSKLNGNRRTSLKRCDRGDGRRFDCSRSTEKESVAIDSKRRDLSECWCSNGSPRGRIPFPSNTIFPCHLVFPKDCVFSLPVPASSPTPLRQIPRKGSRLNSKIATLDLVSSSTAKR
mmetsp:Transcript_16434/g.36002  ORF Transcript_16434/g.36002 Transcript_16434/m.36002 type:complete len:216 (+) Transcript_16434:77-724(+)